MRGQHTVSDDLLSWIPTVLTPLSARERCYGRRRISSYKQIGVKFDGFKCRLCYYWCDWYNASYGTTRRIQPRSGVDIIQVIIWKWWQFQYLRGEHIYYLKLTIGLTAGYQKTTIRILGGLLSAYHLSDEDPLYLEKAIELADRIMPVFDTSSGLPLAMVNLHHRKGVDDPDNPGLVSTAEAATIQLEFRYLSFLTDNDRYWEAAEMVRILLCIYQNLVKPCTRLWESSKLQGYRHLV